MRISKSGEQELETNNSQRRRWKCSVLLGLFALTIPFTQAFDNEMAIMTNHENTVTLKPSDLLTMRGQLEQQWASDYVKEQPPEAAELDFLIGDWSMTRSVYDLEGAITSESEGQMTAQKLLGGRIIQEIYVSVMSDGRVFRGGVGLHSYIPSTKRWVTASLDASVGANSAEHFILNDEIVYESSFEIQGAAVHLRGRWYNIGKNSFTWEGSGSVDGETWFKTYESRFVRKESE